MKIEKLVPHVVTQIMRGVVAANRAGVVCYAPRQVEFDVPVSRSGRCRFSLSLTQPLQVSNAIADAEARIVRGGDGQ